MDATAPETQLRLSLESAGMLMSPEEFDNIEQYDERYRYELIHGVLVVNPIPSEGEADPNDELGYMLRTYRDHHPQGAALDGTLPERYVRLPHSRRRADRVVWAGLGRSPDPLTDLCTIAVEFVSQSRRDWLRDYVEKRDEYLAAGVSEYWVIDRFRRTMSVFRMGEEGPVEQVVREDDVYRTDLLPGFELPLAQLLAVADRWSGEE